MLHSSRSFALASETNGSRFRRKWSCVSPLRGYYVRYNRHDLDMSVKTKFSWAVQISFEKETYWRATPCIITQKSWRNSKMTEVTINVDIKITSTGGGFDAPRVSVPKQSDRPPGNLYIRSPVRYGLCLESCPWHRWVRFHVANI
jgi:hypothetical protein